MRICRDAEPLEPETIAMTRDIADETSDPSLPSPEEAFRRACRHEESLLQKLRNSRVLFYPGAGKDISPARRFTEIGAVDTIVYCDYIDGEAARGVDRLMERLGPNAIRELQASELGQRCRADFYPSTKDTFGNRDDDDTNPVIGWIAEGRSFDSRGDGLTLVYFNTEAIQTYIHIWGVGGCAPLIVVVQNHGLGCLWTPLSGDCLMYTAAPRLPRFLYVGDIGSEPWPHYRQISRPVVDGQSMHKSKRSLWECELPDYINPDSPLRFLVSQDCSVDPDRAARLQPFAMPSDIRKTAGIPERSVVRDDPG